MRARVDVLAAIAAGGALGSLARWGVAEALPHAAGRLPVSTWTVNVTGAFAIGVLMHLVVEVWPPSRLVRPFWAVGVLGGYTTFSTYALDMHQLLAAEEVGRALGYYLGMALSGLLAVWLGLTLVRVLSDDRSGRGGRDDAAPRQRQRQRQRRRRRRRRRRQGDSPHHLPR